SALAGSGTAGAPRVGTPLAVGRIAREGENGFGPPAGHFPPQHLVDLLGDEGFDFLPVSIVEGQGRASSQRPPPFSDGRPASPVASGNLDRARRLPSTAAAHDTCRCPSWCRIRRMAEAGLP